MIPLVVALMGCGGPVDTASTTTTGVPVGLLTGTPTEPQPGLSCAQRGDNVLLWDCEALFPGTGTATAFLEDADGGLRALEAEQDADLLTFTVWRIRAESAYTVRVQQGSVAYSAEIATGALPEHVRLAPGATGTASFETLLLPQQCGGIPVLMLIAPDGGVLWYVEVADGLTGAQIFVDGFDADADGVTVVVGRTRLREWTWTQELVFDRAYPDSLPTPVHHDVVRNGNERLALSARSVTGADGNAYVMDGVLVLDGAGAVVDEWNLADVYEPSGWVDAPGFWSALFPGHTDWAHSNGLEVDNNGDWLFSARIHDAVIKVRGDRGAADFGTVLWSWSSALDGAMGNDFGFEGSVSPPDFQDQHHPNLDDQGRVWLFDNRQQLADPSRATVWTVDESRSVATLEHAWSLGEHCSVQGSAFPVGSDGVVATCAPNGQIREFVVGDPDPVWSYEARCASAGQNGLVVRAMPVSF